MRANYQARIWRLSVEAYPDLPSPYDSGRRNENGNIEINWCDGEILPHELVDIVTKDNDDKEMDEDNYNEPTADQILYDWSSDEEVYSEGESDVD